MVKNQHPSGPGHGENTCRMCHSLPTGTGGDVKFVGSTKGFPNPGSGHFEPFPVGPNGEHHAMSTALIFGGEVRRTMRVPHLRNLYKRQGLVRTQTVSPSGFGYFHDGGEELDTFFARFPNFVGDQEISDMIAFVLALQGSDLPEGTMDTLLEPPGPPSQDAHAAVGKQITVTGVNRNDPAVIQMIADMTALADAGKVGVIARARRSGIPRGYVYVGGGLFQSDRAAETITTDTLRGGSNPGTETTFTVVVYGTQTRIGIDRDGDGIFDGDDTFAGEAASSHGIRAITYTKRPEGAVPVAPARPSLRPSH
jgi:hypothetical protein